MISSVMIVATVSNHLRNFHLPWVKVLRNAGVRVYGVSNDCTASKECTEAFDGVFDLPFARSPYSFKQALVAGTKLKVLRGRLGSELVHLHTPNAAFWGRLGLRNEVAQGRCKIAYTAHGFHFRRRGKGLANALFYRAEKFGARHTHALLTINEEDFLSAQQFPLAPGGFRELIPGVGVDLSRFSPALHPHEVASQAMKYALKLPETDKLILMVAEFSPGKRHEDAVSALAKLGCSRCHLLFAGFGQPAETLSRQVLNLGLGGRVHFLGFRKDVPNLLAAADVVLLTSEREGLPASVMEAMAMEKSIIVADARGSRDLIEPNCGWTYPVGDTRRLVSLLQKVLSNSVEGAQRGRRAREKVVHHYSWPIVQERLCSIYRRLGVPLAPCGSMNQVG